MAKKRSGKAMSPQQRLAWFHKARFGMFIHFGLYAIPGRGEWVMYRERIPADEYAKLADRFNPKKFDADEWVSLAKQAGMKYMVLTTRHHDGFCLYDSQVSDYKATNTPFGRDLVAEYVTAARKAGMKVGFYYSLLDWRFGGYFERDKYPDSAKAMVRRAHQQVEELMTRYGRIDVLWYDGGWVPNLPKEKLAAFWQAKKLNNMVRKHQPHILINNRSGTNEDLDTPEQHVTASEPGRGWESCMTMGDSCGWGYIKHSPNFKTVPQLIQNLCKAAAGEGNYLLNVGPKPDGSIRNEETTRLREMGEWLDAYGEAIYGSQRCDLPAGQIGLWTRKGNDGYLCIFRWPGEEAVVPLIATKVKSATLLGPEAKRVKVRQEHNGRLVLSGLPARPPLKPANVIKVRFASEPKAMQERDQSAWLEGKA